MRTRIAFACLFAAAGPAAAHVALVESAAPAGGTFVATFRVSHGCSGSPTTALRIEIPPSIGMARPRAKSGWTVVIEHAAGKSDPASVTAITWQGNSLAADEFDEFSLLLKLPKDAVKIVLPATQTCAQGTERWAGGDADHPVPTLTVTPGGPADPMAGMNMGDMPAKHAATAPVTITLAWLRALPAGVPAGGYFTLRNNSDAKIALTGARSADCDMLMLHRTESGGSMTHMGDVKGVDVPAHGTVRFSPGGYHLMCMKPTPEVKPGNTVPVTLGFADGSEAAANFSVRDAAGE